MVDKNYVHAVLLIDRSASMGEGNKVQAAQSSITEFMQSQGKADGKFTVSLYDFSSTPFRQNLNQGMVLNWQNNINYAHNTVPWRKVFGPIGGLEAPKYELIPSGGTALRDSMFDVITDTGKFLAALPEPLRPGRVIFVTVTDGEENSSLRITNEQLKGSVTEHTNKYGWEFIFFGANIDAFTVGANWGITNTVQYKDTGASYTGAYSNFNAALLTSRAAGVSLNSTMTNRNFDADGNPIEGTTP